MNSASPTKQSSTETKRYAETDMTNNCGVSRKTFVLVVLLIGAAKFQTDAKINNSWILVDVDVWTAAQSLAAD